MNETSWLYIYVYVCTCMFLICMCIYIKHRYIVFCTQYITPGRVVWKKKKKDAEKKGFKGGCVLRINVCWIGHEGRRKFVDSAAKITAPMCIISIVKHRATTCQRVALCVCRAHRRRRAQQWDLWFFVLGGWNHTYFIQHFVSRITPHYRDVRTMHRRTYKCITIMRR